MPYALKLYLYLGVWFTAATVLADQWLRHPTALFVLSFDAVGAAIMVIVGRWLFGRKTL